MKNDNGVGRFKLQTMKYEFSFVKSRQGWGTLFPKDITTFLTIKDTTRLTTSNFFNHV